METLFDWIRGKGRLSPPEAIGWAIRLAKHLDTLHQLGVSHGAVSPACVLIASSDPRGRGQLNDPRTTATSVTFHSPERLSGGHLSPTDDTWAVSATLFTALTGAPPFVGASPQDLHQRIMTQGPPNLALYGAFDEQLAAIIRAALAPSLRERLSSVGMLRQRLEAYFPPGRALGGLDVEEGEDDQAATHMLAMTFEDTSSKGPDSMAKLFAPPSFESSRQSSPSSDSQDRQPPPPGEGDATVMRALPAHIIAMAARAAAGSSPPPPDVEPEEVAPPSPLPTAPPAPPPPMMEVESDATRIAPAPDLAAAIKQSKQNQPGVPPSVPRPNRTTGRFAPAAPPASQPGPPSSARGPTSPPGFARAAPPTAPTMMSAQLPPLPGLNGGPASAPRPGFAAPSPLTGDPRRGKDPDDVRTVMHSGAMPTPPAEEEDDDDGARTVMRDSPAYADLGRLKSGEEGRQRGWQPATPPAQPSQPRAVRATALGLGMPGPFPLPAQAAPAPAAAPPFDVRRTGGGPGPQVSALIEEALQHAGPPPNATIGMNNLPQNPQPAVGMNQGFTPFPTQAFEPMQPPGQQGGPLGPMGNNMPPLGQPSAIAGLMGGGPIPPTPTPSGGVPNLGAYPTGAPQPYAGSAYPIGSAVSEPTPQRRGRSWGKWLLLCLFVSMLAAGGTFAFLKYRALLHLPF